MITLDYFNIPYGGCGCVCHRMKGVNHTVPCCQLYSFTPDIEKPMINMDDHPFLGTPKDRENDL